MNIKLYMHITTSNILRYSQLFHVQYSFISSLLLTIFMQKLNKLFESVIACFCMRNYMHTPEDLCVLGPQHNSHLYQIRPLEIWYHIHIPYIYFTVSNLQWLYLIISRKTLHILEVIHKSSSTILYLFRQNTTMIGNWKWEKSMLAISYWGQRLAEHEVIGVKFF